jgi:hypothetical protein
MQRLGGILRVLTNEKMYFTVLNRMNQLTLDNPETLTSYRNLYISYDDLYENYNEYLSK